MDVLSPLQEVRTTRGSPWRAGAGILPVGEVSSGSSANVSASLCWGPGSWGVCVSVCVVRETDRQRETERESAQYVWEKRNFCANHSPESELSLLCQLPEEADLFCVSVCLNFSLFQATAVIDLFLFRWRSTLVKI